LSKNLLTTLKTMSLQQITIKFTPQEVKEALETYYELPPLIYTDIPNVYITNREQDNVPFSDELFDYGSEVF
jgi:hypothetical protein